MSVTMTFVILFAANDNLKSDNRSYCPTFFIIRISIVALFVAVVPVKDGK